MLRKIFKWIGYALLALLLVIIAFAAFNWTLVSNLAKVGGAGIADVAAYQPAQTVAGCKGDIFAADTRALPADAFAKMKAYSDMQGGVGLVVLVDGKVAGEAYRPGASAATRTSSQSMHKAVTAMMIGAAIDQGIMGSFDDPVGDYITEWRGDARGRIPLRRLLTMSSGLHNPSMATGELAAMNMMLGDVTDAALGLEADGQRGTFNYNNGNFQIAGMALSRALKKAGRGDYATFLSKTMWCPLGNADASLWLEHDGGEPRYFAFLDASVRDWARVGELIRGKGAWNGKALIAPATMEMLAAASPGNANYGMGIWRGSPWTKARRYSRESTFAATHGEPYLADDVLFLDGFGGQRVYIVPSAGLVISRSGETSMTWDDAVLVNDALRGMGRAKARP